MKDKLAAKAAELILQSEKHTLQMMEKKKALTAYLPHLSNNLEIHHWGNCTDDDSSKRSFGDVVEGRHEKG